MKKRMLALFLALMLTGLLSACGSADQDTQAPAEEDPSDTSTETSGWAPLTLVFSTSNAESDALSQGIRAMDEYLQEATDGAVKMEIHYSSTLYPMDSEVPAIIKDNLDMCYSEALWLSDYDPSLAMYSAPYLFTSYEHMRAFYDSDKAQEMFDEVGKELGVRPVACAYLGSRTVNLTDDKEVTCRADLENVKLRMPGSEAWMFIGECLGANPIPVNYADLYMALQTGTVEGQDNPLPSIKVNSFYEVTKSVTLTNHIVGVNWMMVSQKEWESWSPEFQELFMEAAAAGVKVTDETNLEQEAQLVEELQELGMKVYSPDLTDFRQEVLDYYFANSDTSNWDMEMYEYISSLS